MFPAAGSEADLEAQTPAVGAGVDAFQTRKALRIAEGAGPAVPVALGIAAIVALRVLRGRRELDDMSPGEVVLFRHRPRKALLRYATSLGLWELNRRTTHFAVTNRRVILEYGLWRRHTHSIPLPGIVDVDVVAGLWEGSVHVSEHGRGAAEGVEIGPLRAPVARRLASTIAAHAGR